MVQQQQYMFTWTETFNIAHHKYKQELSQICDRSSRQLLRNLILRTGE